MCFKETPLASTGLKLQQVTDEEIRRALDVTDPTEPDAIRQVATGFYSDLLETQANCRPGTDLTVRHAHHTTR